MSDVGLGRASKPPRRGRFSLLAWRNRTVASRGFQSWASRNLLTRGVARREGEEIFDLVAGFLHSQVLAAIVELGVLREVLEAPCPIDELARRHGIPPDRMEVLVNAAIALGLFSRRRKGVMTTRKGAALLGVPGLEAMIGHHHTLYRDMADPVAFFRGETDPELARVWPYVFGPGAEIDPGRAQVYSDLMADSQSLVAEETLRAFKFDGLRHVMDVGGGTGAFLAALLDCYPEMRGTLFDLPQVVDGAGARLSSSGVADRVGIVPGSFRRDPLPMGAEAITLVRVCYDHEDETVAALLRACFDALPPGGRLIISEPMSGGDAPTRAGDAYFALYTLAMGTGRTRSAERHITNMRDAGFISVKSHSTHRPFVTGVVSAQKPERL